MLDGISIASSMGLKKLRDEPARLTEESDRIKSELESLVIDNYRIFVENLTCSSHLRNEDKKIEKSCEDMEDSLSTLSAQCQEFKTRVSDFVAAHKRNRKTLEHHIQLVELLEIPQLVDACTRNRFYEEALELANFVNGLERRHLLASEFRADTSATGGYDGPGGGLGGSGVIQSIVNEVHMILRQLRQHLLAALVEDNSLPRELELLGILRKLNSLVIDRQFNVERHSSSTFASMDESSREQLRSHLSRSAESHLQLQYLEARSAWIVKRSEHLHLHVTAAGDIVTSTPVVPSLGTKSGISAAVGTPVGDGDEDKNTPSSPSSSSSSSSAAARAQSVFSTTVEAIELQRSTLFSTVTHFNALFGGMDSLQPSTTIISAWVAQQLEQLLTRLRVALPTVDQGASLRNLFDQTLFFAARLSQVGCDFSPLVLDLFEECLSRRMAAECAEALHSFARLLETEKVSMEVDGVTKDQAVPAYVRSSLIGATPATPSKGAKAGTASDVVAPSTLMQYPPLAYLVNALLRPLNFARDCPLLGCRARVEASFGACLKGACVALHGAAGTVRKRGERSAADMPDGAPALDEQYTTVMRSSVVPHILQCLALVFQQGLAPSSAETEDGKSVGDPDDLPSSLRVVQAHCSLVLDGTAVDVSTTTEAATTSAPSAVNKTPSPGKSNKV